MRRKDREVPVDVAWEILAEVPTSHLGMISRGRPYVVPMSHAIFDQRIYYHCALAGEKLDAIKANPHVCIEVAVTTEKPGDCYCYRSAIGFGTARIIEDRDLKLRALAAIADRLEPAYPRRPGDEDTVAVIEVELSELTGKERK